VETKTRTLQKLDCSAAHITEPFLHPTPTMRPTASPTVPKHAALHMDPCHALLVNTCLRDPECHTEHGTTAATSDCITSCASCFAANADRFQHLNCDMHATSQRCTSL
jgi:hypothetical protein